MLRHFALALVVLTGCPVEPPEPPEESEKVFSLDELQHIELTMDPGLCPELNQRGEERFAAEMVFDGVRLRDVGIREKCGIGSCSPIEDKTGFTVKFDEFVP